jgi:hypothetical protein
MGNDVPAEQRLQGFEPLRCCGRGGLDRSDFPSEQKADVWSELTQGQPTVLQTLPHNAVTSANAAGTLGLRTS